MSRAQDVRAMCTGWRSSAVSYGAVAGRGRLHVRGSTRPDLYGHRVQETETTLVFDPTQLPLVQDTAIVVDGVTYQIRQVLPEADGLVAHALLAKA